jgi:fucose permease
MDTSMQNNLIRNRETWIAYILLAIYAYSLNILGPITPFLHDELKIAYAVSSLHFSAFAAGILVIGLAGHLVIQRTGHKRALAIGALGLGMGTLLLVLGRHPIATIGAAFIMGVIGSLILAVVPALLAETHGELRAVAISEANVLSSLVSAAAPLLVAGFMHLIIGWRLALIISALVSLGVGISLLRLYPSKGIGVHTAGSGPSLPRLFWVYWIALVLAVSVEFCMIFWSPDYLELEMGILRSRAVQSVSLFLAGMIMGRLISSWLLRYFSAFKIVFTSILLGLLCFLIYWITENQTHAMISLAMIGFFVSGLYPLTLSMALGTAAGNTAQAGARATLASGIAILTLPLILGGIADIVGLRAAFAVVAVLFVTMLLVILIAGQISSHLEPKRAGVPQSQ